MRGRYSSRKFLGAVQILLILAGTLITASCTPSGTSEPEIPSIIASDIPADNSIERRGPAKKINPGQNLRFENISLEEGLSQSSVFCILQDQRGFLWFGTEDGLNMYDGYSFTVYKKDSDTTNSVSSNWIETIYEDNQGILWIGTTHGLDSFNPDQETFTHYQIGPEDNQSISEHHITSLIQDHQGILWIGTVDRGITSFDPETKNFFQYQADPNDPDSISSNNITAIHEDTYGLLWVGTGNGGLNLFNRSKQSWMSFIPDPEKPTSLSHENISSIVGDTKGSLWIGTDGGGLNRLILSYSQRENLADGNYEKSLHLQFQHFQHDSNNPVSLSSNDVYSLHSDPEGMLWIGTRTTGLNLLTPDQDTFVNFQYNPGNPDSLSNNWILSIYQDREGVYWFGTIGAGINKLNLGWRNFDLYRNNPGDQNSLSDEMVRAFQVDQDSLWIGTMFGGLDRLDRSSGKWTHFQNDPGEINSLSSNFVSDIFQDHSGTIWVGTSTSLERLDPETGDINHLLPNPQAPQDSPENNIRAIYEYSPGIYWVGTMAGLFTYDLDNDQWNHIMLNGYSDSHSLDTEWILAFLEDQQGMIWVATWGSGVFRIDPATYEFEHYHADLAEPNSLSSNASLSILQDHSGIIWFSSTNGLTRFDPETKTYKYYLEKDGLPNNTVYCALEDSSGYLWVSTNQGLAQFDPQEEIFYTYNVDDGLQSDEFNGAACYKSESGELFFGGINGFNVFFPNQIQDNQVIPPIALTSFSQEGAELNQDTGINSLKEVTLKWPDNNFEFEFSALSYANPQKNQYAYILEGFDRDWIEIGNRRYGKYTNLPGGTYTLRMKGSNDDGVWNEEGIALSIVVIPPFWGTWWFGGLLIVAVSGVAFGGFKLRVRNLEKRSRELENQVKDRTDKLMEAQIALKETDLQRAVIEERNRLARELHDSVTQSLYSLTLFTEAARHLAEESGTDKLEGYLGQIGSLGLQALKEMRLLVFELRLHALEEDNLVEALEKRLAAVEGRTGVDAQVINENMERQSLFVETQLFNIAQEALNNALKHAEASSVEVKFRQDGTLVEMNIVDDGRGFDPTSLTNSPGMGLNNIRERVEQMGGVLEIDAAPGEGTRVQVFIRTDGPME